MTIFTLKILGQDSSYRQWKKFHIKRNNSELGTAQPQLVNFYSKLYLGVV